MTVEAICGDVKGSKFGTPEVVLRPYTAMLFNCGSSDCDRKMQGWIERWNKWQVGFKIAMLSLLYKSAGGFPGRACQA